jgi:hypothetical protein
MANYASAKAGSFCYNQVNSPAPTLPDSFGLESAGGTSGLSGAVEDSGARAEQQSTGSKLGTLQCEGIERRQRF